MSPPTPPGLWDLVFCSSVRRLCVELWALRILCGSRNPKRRLCVGRQLHAASELGLRSGTLLAVPNPSPPPDTDALEAAVSQALAEAEAQGVGGKDVTPFLLARVTELTGGESLASNVELVLNNARTVSRLFLARLLCLGKDLFEGRFGLKAECWSTGCAAGLRALHAARLFRRRS